MFDGNWADQLGTHLDAVTGHDHLNVGAIVCRKGGDLTGYIRGTDVELRTIASEERSVATTFFFLQNINLTFEFGVGLNGVWLDQNHAAFNVFFLDAAKQKTDVVSSHSFIEKLAEHFYPSHSSFPGVTNTDDLNSLTNLHLTPLNPTSSYSAPTSDGKNIFNGHQEGLVNFTFRLGNRLINSIHQIQDLIDPFIFSTHGLIASLNILKRLKGRTGNNGDVIAWEVITAEQLAHFQFYQLKDFLVIDHVLLVEEHNQCWNTHLFSQKDMFLGLGHRTIRGCDYQNGAIHLGCASNHVFYIVRVAWTIHVGIVALLGFVLDVSRVDGDTTLFLFRSTIDFIVGLGLGHALGCEDVGDRRGESGLAVVNVANGANIDVGLVPFELLACHGRKESRGGFLGWE